MPLVVGVDAGGTGTSVVAQEGETLQTAAGEAANIRTIGIEDAAKSVSRTIARALAGRSADAVVVGAAGAGRDDVARSFEYALRAHLGGARIRVVDDASIALRAAVPEGDGALLIAGTGSIAHAQAGATSYRAGGYGYLLGDEGSGYSIGAAAVKLLLRAYDGRTERGAMLDALAEKLGATSGQDVLAAVYEIPNPVPVIAGIAPLVLEHASAGERSASKIVQAAALELFDLLKAAISRAGLRDREIPIVFAGGLLRANSMLTYLLETRTSNELPLAHVVKNPPPAEMGALALARKLADA